MAVRYLCFSVTTILILGIYLKALWIHIHIKRVCLDCGTRNFTYPLALTL